MHVQATVDDGVLTWLIASDEAKRKRSSIFLIGRLSSTEKKIDGSDAAGFVENDSLLKFQQSTISDTIDWSSDTATKLLSKLNVR